MKFIQIVGLVLFFLGLIIFSVIPFIGNYKLEENHLKETLKEEHYEKLSGALAPMVGQSYSSIFAFVDDFNRYFEGYNEKFKSEENWNEVIWDDYAFVVTKAASTGGVRDYAVYLFLCSIGIGVLGALLYIWPMYRNEPAGIKNNGIYFSGLKARGLPGIVMGIYLIGLYVLIYWYPEYLSNLALM